MVNGPKSDVQGPMSKVRGPKSDVQSPMFEGIGNED